MTIILEIREKLIAITTNHVAKRALMLLSACHKWGMQHKLVSSNPFDGMYRELPDFKWRQENNPNPFSAQEKQKVLEGFANHNKGKKGISYSYYTNFVRFLFLTGCRPSEAIGLQWKDVAKDFSTVSFGGSIIYVGSKPVRNKGSKNNKIRRFPVNEELRELLESMKPENRDPDSLIFSSRNGLAIRYNDFSRRAWNRIVDPIKLGTTPYCCRDTFITEQVAKGVPTAVIAKWADNSVQMIEKYYLGDKALEQLKPL